MSVVLITEPFSGGGSGSGTVTSVNVVGGTTGLTTGGGPVTTEGVITLGGVLNIANGGTGQTTATAAINALLPSQAANSGKFLTTNGTTVSWVTVSGGGGSPNLDGGTPTSNYGGITAIDGGSP
jgi:hypothetical protein